MLALSPCSISHGSVVSSAGSRSSRLSARCHNVVGITVLSKVSPPATSCEPSGVCRSESRKLSSRVADTWVKSKDVTVSCESFRLSGAPHQQKRILRLIRRRWVLTQALDILRPVRPVRPDLRHNVPNVLTQRRNVSYVLTQRFLRPDATSRSPDLQTTPDSPSRRLFRLIVLAPLRFFSAS